MQKKKTPWLCLLVTGWLMSASAVQAQEHIKISGLAYVDYEYILASPDSDEEGDNGFAYRRLYLTTDYTLSDRFSGRARLEANGGDSVPFVKDLYLKWKGALGDGHDLTFGITSPPSFTVSEDGWGYRSLEKTIMDRNGIVSSRDFGIRANGKLTGDGSVKYGVMVANNTRRNETNEEKRVYGQLEWYPSDVVTFTTGADYAAGDAVDFLNLHVFAGFNPGTFRFGAEGFFRQGDVAESSENLDTYGLSVYAVTALNEKWNVVGRVDQVETDFGGATESETFLLAALAYQAEENVRFMPNLLWSKFGEADDAYMAGRITLEVKF